MDASSPPSVDEWLSSSAACALLGVKPASLYAYVSRGWVRSRPNPGTRSRSYAFEDLDRLRTRKAASRGHGPAAASALEWGQPVLDSSITAILPSGPAYRGHRAVDLAGRAGFEEVAEVLWFRSPPKPTAWVAPASPLVQTLKLVPSRAAPVDRFSCLCAFLGTGHVQLPDEPHEATRWLVRWFAASLGWPSNVRVLDACRASTVAEAVLVATGSHVDGDSLRLVNAALILVADHELNASTFAVRVASAAGSSMLACMTAGLAVVSGARHGAASTELRDYLRQAPHPEQVLSLVRGTLANGRSVPGLGHPLYPDGDPRGRLLVNQAVSLAGNRIGVRRVKAFVDACDLAGLNKPTVDVGLVAVVEALNLLPGTEVALFALGRMAGWMAHFVEQRQSPGLLRPRARYVGPPVSPLDSSGASSP